MNKQTLAILGILVIIVIAVVGILFVTNPPSEIQPEAPIVASDSSAQQQQTADLDQEPQIIEDKTADAEQDNQEEEQASEENSETNSQPIVAPSSETIEIDMDMRKYSFTPELIQASPGDTVVLNLTSSDGEHDFVIDELQLESPVLNTGGSTVYEFTIPSDFAAGTYEFYCSIGSHRAFGMVGTLQVTN